MGDARKGKISAGVGAHDCSGGGDRICTRSDGQCTHVFGGVGICLTVQDNSAAVESDRCSIVDTVIDVDEQVGFILQSQGGVVQQNGGGVEQGGIVLQGQSAAIHEGRTIVGVGCLHGHGIAADVSEGDHIGAGASDASSPGGVACRAIGEKQGIARAAGDSTASTRNNTAVAAEGADVLRGTVEVQSGPVVDGQGTCVVKQGVVACAKLGRAAIQRGGTGVELTSGDIESAPQPLGKPADCKACDRSRRVLIELSASHILIEQKAADQCATQVEGGAGVDLQDGFTAGCGRAGRSGCIDRIQGNTGSIQSVCSTTGSQNAAAAQSQGEVAGEARACVSADTHSVGTAAGEGQGIEDSTARSGVGTTHGSVAGSREQCIGCAAIDLDHRCRRGKQGAEGDIRGAVVSGKCLQAVGPGGGKGAAAHRDSREEGVGEARGAVGSIQRQTKVNRCTVSNAASLDGLAQNHGGGGDAADGGTIEDAIACNGLPCVKACGISGGKGERRAGCGESRGGHTMADVDLVAAGSERCALDVERTKGSARNPGKSSKVQDGVSAIIGDIDHALSTAHDEGTTAIGGGGVAFRGSRTVANEVQSTTCQCQVVIGQTASTAGCSRGVVERQDSRWIHHNAAGGAEIHCAAGKNRGGLAQGQGIAGNGRHRRTWSDSRAGHWLTHADTGGAGNIQGGGSHRYRAALSGRGADAKQAIGTAQGGGSPAEGRSQGVERIASDVESTGALVGEGTAHVVGAVQNVVRAGIVFIPDRAADVRRARASKEEGAACGVGGDVFGEVKCHRAAAPGQAGTTGEVVGDKTIAAAVDHLTGELNGIRAGEHPEAVGQGQRLDERVGTAEVGACNHGTSVESHRVGCRGAEGVGAVELIGAFVECDTVGVG